MLRLETIIVYILRSNILLGDYLYIDEININKNVQTITYIHSYNYILI